jgi:hypothetical protein
MLKVLSALIDRIFAVLGAILFCQIPNIINQYYYLLKGALHEAKKNLLAIENQAIMLGLTLQEFIQKHIANPEPAFQSSGKIMQDSLDRFQNYKQALMELENSSIWEKPYVFLKNIDWELFSEIKWDPQLPLNTEAAIYGFLGILFGLFVHLILFRLPGKYFSKKKKKYSPNVYSQRPIRKS